MDPRDALVWLLARVPLRLADALAWLVAWTWWLVLPVRRRVGVENLRAALPHLAPRPVLTRMMHDLVLGYVELLQYERGRVRVDVDAPMPPGSLLVSGHGGAWDLALLACADHHPVAIFLKTPADPWVRAWLAERRRRHDVGALETGSTLEDAQVALAAGRSVIFIQDQRYARGIESPFFGRPARTSTGLATLALATGRPVWAAWPVRVGRAHHVLTWRPLPLPPPTGDRAVDRQRITDTVNAWYEARVRETPHGWLWLHRRWR